MNRIVFSAMAVSLLCISAFLVFVPASSDAVWVDPNYREPPEADHVITITDSLDFTSSDPAYTIRWSYDGVSGASDLEAARYFTLCLSWAVEGFGSSSYKVEECLPSWITWDSYYRYNGNPETGVFELTIRPALQQVSEDTTGNYWIWFEIVTPSGLSTQTDIFLLKFTVDVSWSGSVIVPDEYVEFVIRYDYGLGGQGNYTERHTASSDTTEYRFTVPDSSPDREDYVFKGWSTLSGSSQTNVGEVYPLNISNSDVKVSENEGGATVYSMTLYAVWEYTGDESLELPDPLQDLLDLLSDPWVMILLFIGVFCVALIVRNRKMGEW